MDYVLFFFNVVP